MRKGKVMRPFRPPRQSIERPARAEPTDQTNPEPQVIPYIKGIKMMSYREALECSEHGEVLRWSSDSDGEQVTLREKASVYGLNGNVISDSDGEREKRSMLFFLSLPGIAPTQKAISRRPTKAFDRT